MHKTLIFELMLHFSPFYSQCNCHTDTRRQRVLSNKPKLENYHLVKCDAMSFRNTPTFRTCSLRLYDWRAFSVDGNFHGHRRENLTSYKTLQSSFCPFPHAPLGYNLGCKYFQMLAILFFVSKTECNLTV